MLRISSTVSSLPFFIFYFIHHKRYYCLEDGCYIYCNMSLHLFEINCTLSAVCSQSCVCVDVNLRRK